MALTDQNKKSILQGLIQQAEVGIYSLTIQARVAKKVEDEQGLRVATEQLTRLEKTIDGYRSEMKKVNKECTVQEK